ncbi:hypothetical protein EII28_11950 [Fusobacterium nucleatum]|jgi:hypothetical protein|uniref:Uncharacterized protein n=1 Tax=Fusobacterium nucleatum TaxID=851 RepID=A0A3P1VKS5_FUSNU|nr:hypothetical protein [Fusobacterium nucleatum]RRD34327.1 hypothetical protein EII28_11950 [Fusobacterium nucleatum]
MKYLVIFLSNLILKNDMDAPLTFALGWFIAIIIVTIFQIIFIQIFFNKKIYLTLLFLKLLEIFSVIYDTVGILYLLVCLIILGINFYLKKDNIYLIVILELGVIFEILIAHLIVMIYI